MDLASFVIISFCCFYSPTVPGTPATDEFIFGAVPYFLFLRTHKDTSLYVEISLTIREERKKGQLLLSPPLVLDIYLNGFLTDDGRLTLFFDWQHNISFMTDKKPQPFWGIACLFTNTYQDDSFIESFIHIIRERDLLQSNSLGHCVLFAFTLPRFSREKKSHGFGFMCGMLQRDEILLLFSPLVILVDNKKKKYIILAKFLFVCTKHLWGAHLNSRY